MAVATAVEGADRRGMTQDERFVVVASSTGTVFEWYDFYLYATLAPFFASLFFPPGNDTAALLSAFATYAAGFLVRPFGAIFFGRIGDLVGRKYTFLVTIMVMGISTFAVGLLPTFATVGWLAPVLLVLLRLLQGLALGGEYGGAATYVAEHAHVRQSRLCDELDPDDGDARLLHVADRHPTLPHYAWMRRPSPTWGWRIPFLVSVVPADLLGLDPAQAQREPGLRPDEGRGQGLDVAADRLLPALSQQQIRPAGAARRHDGAGRGLVHRPVLRAVLPDSAR